MADLGTFASRYERWAIVAGASEGHGAAFAEELAARGLNLILVARRSELLQTLASVLVEKYQVETKLIALNLLGADAAGQIVQQTVNLEVGLLMSLPL